MSPAKTKIAIISHALGGGGAERFGALLSFILSDLGYEIHNIILNQPQDYEYSGTLLNLGTMKKKFKWQTKFSKAIVLKKYLKQHNINTIIDNRPRSLLFREWITRRVYGNRRVLYLIQNYNLKNYIPQNKVLANLFYKNASKLICVSMAIEEKVTARYHFKNTTTIYNPVRFFHEVKEAQNVPDKFILYFGRFDESAKNFTLMLEAFSLSKIYHKGYTLVLMGEGPDLDFIKNEIHRHDLKEYVQILPYQKNPFGAVKKARYTILSSHFEGFPLSIVESLAAGTPVIAVDCMSGPAEIIKSAYNGILVENYNAEAFSKAMNLLIDDEKLYQFCKSNAPESVAHLSIAAISEKWKEVLSNKNHAV